MRFARDPTAFVDWDDDDDGLPSWRDAPWPPDVCVPGPEVGPLDVGLLHRPPRWDWLHHVSDKEKLWIAKVYPRPVPVSWRLYGATWTVP